MGRVVVHHLLNSRSTKIIWLLEELEVPYTIQIYHRNKLGLAPPELKQVHPLGKSPVITDGDLTIAESGAIVEYLLQKYGNGKLRPIDSGYVDNLYFSNYAEGTLMPIIIQKLIFSIVPGQSPFLVRPIAKAISSHVTAGLIEPQLQNNGKLIETALGKSKTGWFVGGPEPTSSDFLMLYAIENLDQSSPDVIGEHSRAWLKKVYRRPAYKVAIEKLAAKEKE